MNDMNDSTSGRRPTLEDMINSQSSRGSSNGGGKRRMSMAEMLRQSPLMGNTVALPDAVESAQVAKALKEDPQTELAAPVAVPEAPVPQSLPFAQPIPVAIPEPRSGSNRYNLYARVQGKWTWQCDIHAATHAEGMRQAIAWLKPEHDAFPIRLEQDELAAA